MPNRIARARDILQPQGHHQLNNVLSTWTRNPCIIYAGQRFLENDLSVLYEHAAELLGLQSAEFGADSSSTRNMVKSEVASHPIVGGSVE